MIQPEPSEPEATSDTPIGPDRSVILGFLASGAGFLILPIADAIGKMLGLEGIHPLQLSWGRWVANAAIMIPIVVFIYGRAAFRPTGLGLQAVRALCLVGATGCFFTAIIYLPLATVTATLFLAPLLVTALSGIFLKERVGPWRLGAVCVGFLGMLLIVKPGFASFGFGTFFALGTAVFFGFYLLLTRKIAGRNPAMVTTMWMGIIGVCVMSVVVVPFYEPFTPRQIGFVGLMGAILTFGHCLVIWAADRLEASAMAPMPYLEMVTSTTLGFLMFGEFPVLTTWLGCGCVILSGLCVAWRESRNRKIAHE